MLKPFNNLVKDKDRQRFFALNNFNKKAAPKARPSHIVSPEFKF